MFRLGSGPKRGEEARWSRLRSVGDDGLLRHFAAVVVDDSKFPSVNPDGVG